MDPKVSVIVPVYNTSEYLRECLDSILFQTLRDIEIIVVNDASTDGSAGIIHEYEEKDNRIIFIDKPVNEGVGEARNSGIKRAKGEFVCFIDSDDLYSDADVLEILYEAAHANSVRVSGGRIEILKESVPSLSDEPITEYNVPFHRSGLTFYSDYQYDYGYTCYLFDRQMILENKVFFPSYSRFQDPPFFVRTMWAARQFYFVDKPIYRYRQETGVNKRTMKKAQDMLCGIMDNLSFSREKGLAKLHYLTACRLDSEGSYMAVPALFESREDSSELLYKLIQASSMVDSGWLKENGFVTKEPFVPEVFEYAVTLGRKYEALRSNKIALAAKRILGRK